MNKTATVFLVDDDAAVRDSLGLLLRTAELRVQTYASAAAFLDEYRPDQPGCLILDLRMPGMDGINLQAELKRRFCTLPIVFLTAYGDIPTTVRAMQAGALNFLTKPVAAEVLVRAVQAALIQDAEHRERRRPGGEECLTRLTPREGDVAALLVAGCTNKQIGRRLGISFRTVETHRARIMEKTGCANLIELAHLIESIDVAANGVESPRPVRHP